MRFSEVYKIKTINLKVDMPTVQEALQRLERELVLARQREESLLKIIHGYGSTGVGGEIRIAIQKRLREMVESGEVRACIFGEDWRKGCDEAWRLLQGKAELKNDPDLGRGNRGITVVLL